MITLLEVGRHWIMYLCFYFMLTQIGLQLVTAFCEDRENMPNAIAIGDWHAEEWGFHLIYI